MKLMTRLVLGLLAAVTLAWVAQGTDSAQAQDPDPLAEFNRVDLHLELASDTVGVVEATLGNRGLQTAYEVVVVVDIVYPESGSFQEAQPVPPGGSYTLKNNNRRLVFRLPRLEGADTVMWNLNISPTEINYFEYASEVSSASYESADLLDDNSYRLWTTRSVTNIGHKIGYYAVTLAVDNAQPSPGETANLTVTLDKGPRDSPLHDLEIAVELADGLMAGNDPTFGIVPLSPFTVRPQDLAALRYERGVFVIGDELVAGYLGYTMELPVTVDADAEGTELCVTALITGNPPAGYKPYFDDPIDNFAELCLGGPRAAAVLSADSMDLLDLYDCVGKAAYPCDSVDTLELVASGTAVNVEGRAFEVWQPSQVVVQVQDPVGRDQDSGMNLVWRNGYYTTDSHGDPVVALPGVFASLSLPSPDYNDYNLSIADATPGGKPGSFSILNGNNLGFTVLDIDTKTTFGPVITTATSIPLVFQFGALGAYVADITISATDQSDNTEYTATGTYTFHVGPMADLRVRDGGASPSVAAGQHAITVVAVNNGPSNRVDAEVTIDLPAGVTVSNHDASEGTYANDVWNLGELEHADFRRSLAKPEGATLTLILEGADAATATATIANVVADYEVCIGSDGNDLDHDNETACESDTTNGGSWHSTPVYDYNDSNNTVTVEAQPGAPGSAPGIPALETPVVHTPAVGLAWSEVPYLHGVPVERYETQQSANGSDWVQLETDLPLAELVDRTIASGQTRHYRVRAVSAAGVAGPWSLPVIVRTSGAEVTPSVPTGVSASADGGNSIVVSWQVPDDDGGLPITGYQVQRSASGAGGWSNVFTTDDGATMSYTDDGIDFAATRYYQVRARNSAGWGSWSASVSATTEAGVPGVPRNFRATADGANAIELTWAAPSNNGGSDIVRYEIDWSGNGVDWQAENDLLSVGAAETSYTHVGLDPGTERHYRIRAVNGAMPGEGSWSAVRSATTGAVAPSAPGNLEAEADGKKAITLTWVAPANIGGADITGYELRVSSGEAGVESSYSRLTSVSGSQREYSHASGLSPGDTRHYQVRARNSAGWGPWSDVATATTQTGVPDAPGSFRATANGSSEIILTWTEPNDEGEAIFHYEVQESEDGSRWRILTFVTGGYHEYADGGLAPGTTKYYRVLARNVNGPGAWSVVRSATTTAGAPAAPTSLTATADGEKTINLSWGVPNDNGAAITGYRVERSRDGQAPWEQLRSSGTGTTYRDTKDLYPGMTRHYRVAARNSAGWGAWSAVVSGTTAGEPASPPGWVNLLRFTSVGSSSVGLAWNAPPTEEGDPPVTGYEYQVYRPSGPDEVKKTTGTSIGIGGLTAGQHYEFGVRAVNAVGGGPWEHLTAYVGGSGSVSVSSTSLTVTEGGSASYTVRLSRAPTGPVALNLGSPWFTGMSFREENDPYGVVLTPSGWTKPKDATDPEKECAALARYTTFRAWNQGVTVTFSVENDDIDTGDEVGVFTHEVFPLSAGDLCGGAADTEYDPYRVGPGVLVTRRDND